MTLNGPNRRVISMNSIAFRADYVKVPEDTPILSAAEMYWSTQPGQPSVGRWARGVPICG